MTLGRSVISKASTKKVLGPFVLENTLVSKTDDFGLQATAVL